MCCRSVFWASRCIICSGIGDDGVGEGRELAVLEMQDAVGHVEDAVVVRDQQDGGAPLPGQ